MDSLRRRHIYVSGLTLALLSVLTILSLVGEHPVLSVWAATLAGPVLDFPPPASLAFVGTELVTGDNGGGAQPQSTTATGTYPGEDIAIRFYWTKQVEAGKAATFDVNVTYPSDYVAYDHATPGDYVSSCEHVAAEHKVHCVGTFPAPATTQVMTGTFLLVTQATCGLYPNAPAQLEYSGGVVFDDGSSASTVTRIDVAQPLELDAFPVNPQDNAKDVPIVSNGETLTLEWKPYREYSCNMVFAFPDFYDLTYKVYLRRQGGEWQVPKNIWNACDEKVQLYPDELACLSNGDPSVYQWRVDLIDLKYQDCREPDRHVWTFTTGTCYPKVTLIPQYGDYFLTTLGVPNKYRAEVIWHGTAYPDPPEAPYGKVIFDLNGEVTEVPGQSWGAEHTYNMGTDFIAGLTGGNNKLSVKAINLEGMESPEVIVEPMVFPIPAWIAQFVMGNFDVDLHSRTVSYSRGVEFPNPHFKALYKIPDWVPYLGGAEVGVIETYAAVGAEAKSDGSGSASVGGSTGVQIAENKKATGHITGAGEVRFSRKDGLSLTKASLKLGITGEIGAEMGLADLVPGVKAAEEWWLVGRFIRWFNKRATVNATITPDVEIETIFKNGKDGLAFDNGTGTGKLEAAVELTLRLFKGFKAAVRGGGEPRVTVQVPASGPWGYLKEIAIRLAVKATLTIWRFEGSWERGVTCSVPTGACEGDEGEDASFSASPEGWHLMGRDYISDDYATFVGNAVYRVAAFNTSGTTETPLVTDVYPLANPALAVRDDGERMVLWIHDDDAKPVGQGEEIHAAHWNGTTWVTATLTNDNVQDFSPQVAFDVAGNAVAVWERTNTVHISPTLDITYVQSLEIASAVWDKNTKTWSTVVSLTNDSLLDTAPQLERGLDGTLMALWLTGDGNDLLGTASHPVSFTYAVWSGSAWSTPITALGGLQDVLGVDSAVYSATQAALVYVRDMDGDVLTEEDTELYYATWDGTAWSGPTRLVSDTIGDVAPSLSYNSVGQPVVVWLRGDDLVTQTGWGGSPTVLRASSTGGAFLDTQLVRQSNGNLALLWQTLGADGTDAAYSVYDVVNDSWGADNTLMRDAAIDESFAPALASDGTLYMAYNKVEIEFVTETVEISSTLSVTVTHVPQPVQTDLYLLSHTLGRDLGITATDIAFSTPNPAPGHQVTITATVHNLGDLAVAGGQVAFYEGDPHAGGVQIGSTQSLTSPFRAATTDTVTVTWDVPITATAHTVYVVVDPTNTVSEADEANNQASVGAALPDLDVDWTLGLRPDSDALVALLTNRGYSPVTVPFEVAFRASDVETGTLLGTVVVSNTIGVGESVTVSLPITDPAALSVADNRFWVVADDQDKVVEGDETNNTDFAALNALPDLTVYAYEIKSRDPVSVTVRNIGVITATDVAVAAWPDGAGGPAYTKTLVSLGPRASGTITFDVARSVWKLWVRVDPNDAIPESNETNNLSARRLPGDFRVYLPLVLR